MPEPMFPQEAAATFRKRLALDETAFGCFLSLGSPLTAELMAWAGYDWGLIDLEHGAGGESDVLGQLQALSGTGCLGIVRAESNERQRVHRVLDAGAHGVMFPRIDTPDQAAAAVAGMHYPPRGVRGVAFSNRASAYGANFRPYMEGAANLLCIIQIESPQAVGNSETIAAMDGVDILFLGPTDLSHQMGILGRYEDPGFVQNATRVAQAARAAGKIAGCLLPTPADFARFHAMGYRFIASGSDAVMLNNSARALISTLHKSRAEV